MQALPVPAGTPEIWDAPTEPDLDDESLAHGDEDFADAAAAAAYTYPEVDDDDRAPTEADGETPTDHEQHAAVEVATDPYAHMPDMHDECGSGSANQQDTGNWSWNYTGASWQDDWWEHTPNPAPDHDTPMRVHNSLRRPNTCDLISPPKLDPPAVSRTQTGSKPVEATVDSDNKKPAAHAASNEPLALKPSHSSSGSASVETVEIDDADQQENEAHVHVIVHLHLHGNKTNVLNTLHCVILPRAS